jgi:hypothetical protein
MMHHLAFLGDAKQNSYSEQIASNFLIVCPHFSITCSIYPLPTQWTADEVGERASLAAVRRNA